MTAVHVTIYTQDKDVEKMLNRMDSTLDPVNLMGFLEAPVREYVQKRAKGRFASEGDDVTGKWFPLADATQVIRAQAGYGAAHPINKRTGELENFITESPAGTVIDPYGATMVYPGSQPTTGVSKKLTGAQQGGVGSSGKQYPARPVLGMNETDLAEVSGMLAVYISTGRHR